VLPRSRVPFSDEHIEHGVGHLGSTAADSQNSLLVVVGCSLGSVAEMATAWDAPEARVNDVALVANVTPSFALSSTATA
jgi:pimeloyl-ACP methyl ester carboxylesterase